jgi:hypothetical protein
MSRITDCQSDDALNKSRSSRTLAMLTEDMFNALTRHFDATICSWNTNSAVLIAEAVSLFVSPQTRQASV